MSRKTWDEMCDIAQHDAANIKGFFGPYRWLSNFHPAVLLAQDGHNYSSSECAYQAHKVSLKNRHRFDLKSGMTAAGSKKAWKSCPAYTPEEWDEIKNEVMLHVVFEKFRQNLELRDKLIATGRMYLEETNWWGDKYWGVSNGEGHNRLGVILMGVRLCFQKCCIPDIP